MTTLYQKIDTASFVIGRTLIGIYFILPAIKKITGYAATLALMNAKGVPLAEALLPLTIALQLGLGLLLIFGMQLRLGSLILFGLVILINVYIHNFWALEGDPNYAHELQNFIKNLAIAGGLLVLASKQQNRQIPLKK